ncbi:MAG: heme exporter protein CcmB [Candidatus Zixiibacteriota bacterium]
MPESSVGSISKAYAVLAKDVRLELRTRYALNAILMFGITTLAVVSFSLGQSGLPPKLLAALFWIVMFFSAMSGLAQVFVREEEAGTAMALRLGADPNPIFIGKLFFNLGLLTVMSCIVTPMFFILTDAPTENIIAFLPVLALGVIGLCAATTMIAAIIARASVKGALFSVLSFPVLMPLLLILVRATDRILEGSGIGGIASELQFLVAYAVIMVTLSVLLFEFVWQD